MKHNAYPPRFKTLEAAQKALFQGDWSDQVFPFEVKNYDEIGERVIHCKEYEDAPYELQWMTRDGGICHAG